MSAGLVPIRAQESAKKAPLIVLPAATKDVTLFKVHVTFALWSLCALVSLPPRPFRVGRACPRGIQVEDVDSQASSSAGTDRGDDAGRGSSRRGDAEGHPRRRGKHHTSRVAGETWAARWQANRPLRCQDEGLIEGEGMSVVQLRAGGTDDRHRRVGRI